jgi:hypothetical protein
MEWLVQSIKGIIGSGTPDRRTEIKRARTKLDDEKVERMLERAEIGFLEKKTGEEWNNLRKSLTNLEDGETLLSRKKAEIQALSALVLAGSLHIDEAAGRIRNICEIISEERKSFERMRGLIRTDLKRSSVRKFMVKMLNKDNLKEMKDEARERELFDDLNEGEEEKLAEERLIIDYEEWKEEKNILENMILDERYLKYIHEHDLFTRFNDILSEQEKILKSRSMTAATMQDMEEDLRKEENIFSVFDEIERRRSALISKEIEEEEDIMQQETVANAIGKMARREEKIEESIAGQEGREDYLRSI